jgi:hypothetical protein
MPSVRALARAGVEPGNVGVHRRGRCPLGDYGHAPQPGILFLTQLGPNLCWDGAEIGQDQLALVSAGDGYVSRLLGPTSWGCIQLDADDMEAICRL